MFSCFKAVKVINRVDKGKGIVPPIMKIKSTFTHPNVVLMHCDILFFFWTTKRDCQGIATSIKAFKNYAKISHNDPTHGIYSKYSGDFGVRTNRNLMHEES